MKNKNYIVLILTFCLLLFAAGCGNTGTGTVAAPASDTTAANAARTEETAAPTEAVHTEESFTGVLTDDSISSLEDYPNLKEADLSGSACYDSILAFMAAHPDIAVRYTVMIDGISEPVSNEMTEVSVSEAVSADALAEYAPYLQNLQKIALGSTGVTADQINALYEAYPNAELTYTVQVLGKEYDQNVETLNLSALQPDQVPEVAEALAKLKQLTYVELMPEGGESALQMEDVKVLAERAPQAAFNYVFTLFGQEVSTADERLEYVSAQIGDSGLEQIREVLPAMNRLTYLKLDSCKTTDEAMAQLRDDFPDVKVVWRVWFGPYNVCTDETRILASIKGYCLTAAACESLKYCTDVKYLDIGHNTIEDISFVEYMPNLEVAVLAINYWSDATPIASCKNLEYLEVFNTNLTDLTPLAELTNLKHLNVCFLKNLSDITPLYGMTQLERLWIGSWNSVPEEQLEEIREKLPNTEINTEVIAPIEGGWREGERYELLQQQMGYNTGNNGQPEYSLG